MSNAWSAVAGNARNGQATFISNCQYGDYEYAILVRHDWHPIVCKRQISPTVGTWSTHDVYNTVIGLIKVSDSHMGISIGVDPNGKIHVTGNTHDTTIRHIISTNPEDITSWQEAPKIPKLAKYFTNLVENGVVENNQTGWAALDGRFTMDRVTHSYGWGSSHGNDLNCQATRLTRTVTSPDNVIGHGTVRSISGSGFSVTPGNKYTAHLSFRANMASPKDVQHQLWLVFRNGSTEVSRVASETRTATNVTLWYRPSVIETVAPVGVDNAILEFRTIVTSGNSSSGDAMWVDGAMLYEGDKAADIVYRDGAFNGGYEATGWTWNGTAYASTSTGPIRTDGYAGINSIAYHRFLYFSDGTLVLSGAAIQYPNDPVGRCWAMWKMEPGDTNFSPLIDGSDGMVMRNIRSVLKQGSTYPVEYTGNEPDGGDTKADRAYAYFTYIDENDVLHMMCWFREYTSNSWGYGIYVKSEDRGQTWSAIDGTPVSMPLTESITENLNHPNIIVGGSHIQGATGTSMAIDKNGYPHMIYGGGGNPPFNGRFYLYWDGTNWVQEDMAAKYGFVENGTLSIIRGDVWIWGAKNVDGRLAVWGANHTQDTGLIVRAGNVNFGTPDGVYQFESGATYEGTPNAFGEYRRLIPDNNSPRIFSFGKGPRGKKV